MLLSVKPMQRMNVKVGMIEVGMASAAMMRRPPVADEQQDRGRDQDGGEQQVELHLLDRRS